MKKLNTIQENLERKVNEIKHTINEQEYITKKIEAKKKEDEDKDEEETKIIILQLKNSLNEMNVLERIRNKADRS